MNPITYALSTIKHMIPIEILQRTFITNQKLYGLPNINLDAIIRDIVIEGRVLVDCNLVGGQEVTVPLDRCAKETQDHYNVVYRIPKSLTQNRRITTALSVSYGSAMAYSHNMYLGQDSSSLMGNAAGLLASASAIPDVSTAHVRLIDENVVLLTNTTIVPLNLHLRCRIENESNMNNLQPTMYQDFAELVVWAVKAYIYVNNRIPMNRGYVEGGWEIGTYKEEIDSYQDANENYMTLVKTKWRKLAIINDNESYNRYLSSIIGGAW